MYVRTKMNFLGQNIQRLEPEEDAQTRFCLCDLDLMTLMYDLDLDILKMYLRVKSEATALHLLCRVRGW